MNESDEPLFCLADVAKALGYSNPSKAVIDHCKGITVLETPTQSGVQPIKYGKESEVYRLTMKSKLPDAEKFQDWVCDEVLPSIRKHSGYIAAKQEGFLFRSPLFVCEPQPTEYFYIFVEEMPIGIFKCNERLFIKCGKQPFSLI